MNQNQKSPQCAFISSKKLGGILHQDFIANLSENNLLLLDTV